MLQIGCMKNCEIYKEKRLLPIPQQHYNAKWHAEKKKKKNKRPIKWNWTMSRP